MWNFHIYLSNDSEMNFMQMYYLHHILKQDHQEQMLEYYLLNESESFIGVSKHRKQ